jgi:hypothetical protein
VRVFGAFSFSRLGREGLEDGGGHVVIGLGGRGGRFGIDIDALVVGMPDHWHAILTVLGRQAVKHIYVEKPDAHNLKSLREVARRPAGKP